MLKFIKFLKDTSGAIAVETAVAAPIIIFALLPAIDLGLKVYGKQKLMKATKSGIEFVNEGSRNQSDIYSVMNSSFGGDIAEDALSIEAFCGCVEQSAQPDSLNGVAEDDKYGYVYVKTATQFGENMCPTTCDSGDQSAELVNISLSHNISGIVSSETITTKLQTRVR